MGCQAFLETPADEFDTVAEVSNPGIVRESDDPDSSATVVVRTGALPPGSAGVQAQGVALLHTDDQIEAFEILRE